LVPVCAPVAQGIEHQFPVLGVGGSNPSGRTKVLILIYYNFDMDSQVAVKAVIQNQDGKFLIVREGRRWQAVGGRLEKGEKLQDGLRRETKEETGIANMEIGRIIHADEWFAKPEDELKHIVALFFLCKTNTSDIVLSKEHNKYAWVTPGELDDYGDSIEPEISRAIRLVAEK
jgi:8-oxo-dGTP pyrophosphatase MutT (NUDIX family)